jgi:hypothetical protein
MKNNSRALVPNNFEYYTYFVFSKVTILPFWHGFPYTTEPQQETIFQNERREVHKIFALLAERLFSTSSLKGA